MAIVQSWYPTCVKTPRKTAALRWMLLEGVLTRFVHAHMPFWLFSAMCTLLQWGVLICTDNNTQLCDDFSLQFTASSPREAREWVDQINFVLKGRVHGVHNSVLTTQTLFDTLYWLIVLLCTTTVLHLLVWTIVQCLCLKWGMLCLILMLINTF